MARGGSWLDALPLPLLGTRATLNENGFSSSTAVTGTTILSPSSLISPRINLKFVLDLGKQMRLVDSRRLS